VSIPPTSKLVVPELTKARRRRGQIQWPFTATGANGESSVVLPWVGHYRVRVLPYSTVDSDTCGLELHRCYPEV